MEHRDINIDSYPQRFSRGNSLDISYCSFIIEWTWVNSVSKRAHCIFSFTLNRLCLALSVGFFLPKLLILGQSLKWSAREECSWWNQNRLTDKQIRKTYWFILEKLIKSGKNLCTDLDYIISRPFPLGCHLLSSLSIRVHPIKPTSPKLLRLWIWYSTNSCPISSINLHLWWPKRFITPAYWYEFPQLVFGSYYVHNLGCVCDFKWYTEQIRDQTLANVCLPVDNSFGRC